MSEITNGLSRKYLTVNYGRAVKPSILPPPRYSLNHNPVHVAAFKRDIDAR